MKAWSALQSMCHSCHLRAANTIAAAHTVSHGLVGWCQLRLQPRVGPT